MDKHGRPIDFLLTEQRDELAAARFLTKAIRRHGVPETITIDGSEANAAAIRGYNEVYGTAMIIRQVKYLNNVVEQDHRAVKRVTRPMLGFKSFEAAQSTLVGIELMHMLKKGQMALKKGAENLTTGRPVLCPGCLILSAAGPLHSSPKTCDRSVPPHEPPLVSEGIIPQMAPNEKLQQNQFATYPYDVGERDGPASDAGSGNSNVPIVS